VSERSFPRTAVADSASRTTARFASLVALTAAVGTWAGLARPLLRREIWVASDLGTYFLPVRAFYARALERGEGFLWFPDLMGGFNLHGEGAAGLLHPLNLLGYWLLPLDVSFDVELLRSYPVLFVGAWLLLRRWSVRTDAALLGALLFTFSGFNLLHFMHLNAIAIVAHVPWLLLGIDLTIRGASGRERALGVLLVALLTTSELLLGYPQYFFFSAITEAGYLACLPRGAAFRSRLLVLALAKLCGVAGGAVQLVPSFHALEASVRVQHVRAFALSYSLDPINLLQLVAPYLFDGRAVGETATEFGLYAGAAAPVLTLWLALHRRDLAGSARLAAGAAVLGVLALILALGRHGLVYHLQTWIPLVSSFRAPCRYILLVHLALAVLAALGYRDLAARAERGEVATWRSLRPLAALPLASLFAVAVGAWWSASGAEPTAILAGPAAVWAGPFLVALATGAVTAAARGVRLAPVALVAIAAVDLAAYGLSFVWREPPSGIAAFAARVDRPEGAQGQRVRGSYLIGADNRLSLVGIRRVGGHVALPPRRPLGQRIMAARWFDDSLLAALRVSSVSWVAQVSGGVSSWVRIDGDLPRARLVSRARTTADLWHDLPRTDLVTMALLEEPLELAGGRPGTAEIGTDRSGAIDVSTEAESRQLLVVTESWDTGWSATVDGEPVRALRVYGDFLGCVVGPGRHRVALRFDPTGLRLGAWLSAAGLVSAALLAAAVAATR